MTTRTRLTLVLFFLSGVTGLVYEVLWSKCLAFVFGNSTSATAAVLAAFMGGLALGSWLAGRMIPRWRRLVATYGLVEASIGCYCVVLPFLLDAIRPVLAAAYDPSGPTLVFGLTRLTLVLGLLLVPSTLMGMTFPLLGAEALRHAERPGRVLGLLYGANCCGAVGGALASSFVLIPTLGLFKTTLAAGLTNVLIGLAAWRCQDDEVPARPAPRRAGPLAKAAPTLLVVFAAAGMASMLYQLAWTRVFSLLFGSSVYVFSVILAAFIGGLSLGSFWISSRLDEIARPDRWMAAIEAGIGVAGFAITALLRWAPLACAAVYPDVIGLSFSTICALQFAVVTVVVLVPTTLMGMLMPLVGHYLSRGAGEPGSALGTVYGANTAGCIVGSLAGGFVLMPALGLKGTLVTASAVNLALAVFLWCRAEGTTFWRFAVGAAAIVGLTLLLPAWDTAVLTSGPYVYAKMYHNLAERAGATLEETIRAQGHIVFHKEGESCVVTVRRFDDGVKSLHVNGKTDASTQLDMKTQLLVSHLPALCAERLGDVLAVGLGCGASLGAFQTHPCRSIDCIEICPEIVEAAELFKDATGHSFDDPRVHLVVDDGRTWLECTDRRYDVVMSEPSNPWVAGMTYLFTKEYFDLCRRRLNDGGIMCQWIHAYSMDDTDFRSVLNTFQSVFPRTMLWKSDGKADYIMLGLTSDDPVDMARFRDRFARPAVQASLAAVGLPSADDVLAHFLGGPEVVATLAAGAGTVTDDNLSLEYTAPRNLFTLGIETIYADVAKVMNPADLTSQFFGDGVAELALQYLSKREAEQLVTRASGLVDAMDLDGALAALAESIRLDPTVETTRTAYEALLTVLGRRSFAANDFSTAARYYERLLESNPDSADGHNDLGNCYARTGQLALAKARYRRALALEPNHEQALLNAAVVSAGLGDDDEAITAFERVVALGKDTVAVNNNLALLYVNGRRYDEAAASWKRALKLDPLCAAARRNLARLDELQRAG